MNELENSQGWDKFNFTYQSLDNNEDKQLPCKLLVLGEFGQTAEIYNLKPVEVNARNINHVLATFKLVIELDVAVADEDGGIEYVDLTIPINQLSSFEPASIISAVPYLQSHLQLMEKLKSNAEAGNVLLKEFSETEQQILRHCNLELNNIVAEELTFILYDINEHLYEMLDIVLHHEDFQPLESSWRNIAMLVDNAKQYEHCQIELLDLSQSQITDDFDANRDITETVLFDIVYFQEFAQYGGQPYTAMIADYTFGAGVQDIALLRTIGSVAQTAHVPFIGGVSPKFFNGDDFNQVGQIYDLIDQVSTAKYTKWRSFQQDPLSAYISLALPRIKLRDFYQYPAGVIGPMPYTENTRIVTDNVLLGNASFAFAQCILRSFDEHSACTDIYGAKGGRVEIATNHDGQHTYPNFPIECVLSEDKVDQLTRLGLLPMSINQRSNQLFFNSAVSLRWGDLSKPTTRSRDEILNAQVEAQLPYLFVISKIAHYLKVVQRESVGSMTTINELKNELNRWLKKYVSDVENPAPSIRSRKPLRKAEIFVSEPDVQGKQYLQLNVMPHMKYMGNDFILALNILAD